MFRFFERDKLTLRYTVLALLISACLAFASCSNHQPGTGNAAFAALSPTGASVNLTKSQTAPSYSIDYVDGAQNPVQAPPTVVGANQNVTASGWAGTPNGLAGGVDVVIDGKPFKSNYGLERDDVAAATHNPALAKSGYNFSMPASQIGPGTHTLTVRVISSDKQSYYESPTVTFRIQ